MNRTNGLKVLFANPPLRKGELYGIRSGCRFPYFTDELGEKGIPVFMPFPFTLAQASSLVKNNGIESECWDCIAEGGTVEEFYRRVGEFKPDVYIQEVEVPSYPIDREVFSTLKERFPKMLIGAAGIMVTGFGPEILEKNPAIDFALTYEWEETALEVARKLSKGSDLSGIPGIFHRENGKIIVEPRRARPNLDDLPWPDRDRLPMLNYNDDFAFLPRPNFQMYTSRGCPFGCSFCSWVKDRYGDLRVLHRNPGNVVEEMEFCIKKWGFKAAFFDDDTFNLKKSYVLKFCEEIMKSSVRIPWAAMCRADLFDRETLKACKEAGLYAVKYGIDSGNPRILEKVHKKLDLDKAAEVIAQTREAGIKVHLTMMLGLPGETHQTIRNTWKYAKRVKPDYIQFSIATPYPGTELYDHAREMGWIVSEDWTEFNADSQASMRTEHLSREDLESWARILNLRRIGYQLLRNPWDCFRTYFRKACESPRKVFNIAKAVLG